MTEFLQLDEATVRAAAISLPVPEGTDGLRTEEIADVVVEEGWVGVAVNRAGVSRAFVSDLQRHLAKAFPGVAVEVRAGTHVSRGGEGFGDGRHVLAVLGGKGGVGKSTTAVNLALTLSAMGRSVGLIDGDLNAPDIPHMLNVHPGAEGAGAGWRVSPGVTPPSRWRRPYRRYGIEVMSIGFLISEKSPPALRSRLEISTLLRHLVFETAWTADILLIDAPPGTGEELRVMAGELPLAGAIFVTTPQDLAQMDAERTLTLLTEHSVPVIGLVQNMAGLACPHCGEEIDLFATSRRLSDAGLNILGRIPFDVRLSTAADQGRPLVLGDPRGPVAFEFARIGRAVGQWLAARNGAAG
jgi:ATP-binding protein involved in chromosome partitioning